jgi:hypothetical protein
MPPVPTLEVTFLIVIVFVIVLLRLLALGVVAHGLYGMRERDSQPTIPIPCPETGTLQQQYLATWWSFQCKTVSLRYALCYKQTSQTRIYEVRFCASAYLEATSVRFQFTEFYATMDLPKCSTTTPKPSGLCASFLKNASWLPEHSIIELRRLCQYSSRFACYKNKNNSKF